MDDRMIELRRWKEPIQYEASPVFVSEEVELETFAPRKSWTEHRIGLRAMGVTAPNPSLLDEIHYWSIVHLVDDEVQHELRFETKREALDWLKREYR